MDLLSLSFPCALTAHAPPGFCTTFFLLDLKVEKGGVQFLESSLPGINPPKAVPRGEGVRQFITATKAGDETLPQLLTKAVRAQPASRLSS